MDLFFIWYDYFGAKFLYRSVLSVNLKNISLFAACKVQFFLLRKNYKYFVIKFTKSCYNAYIEKRDVSHWNFVDNLLSNSIFSANAAGINKIKKLNAKSRTSFSELSFSSHAKNTRKDISFKLYRTVWSIRGNSRACCSFSCGYPLFTTGILQMSNAILN